MINPKLKQALDDFIQNEQLSGTSLIMTVFGDSFFIVVVWSVWQA